MKTLCMSMISKCIGRFLFDRGREDSACKCDMVREVSFLQVVLPEHGDKKTSVLDVTYNRPNAFRSSAETSLLGGSLMVQDVG